MKSNYLSVFSAIAGVAVGAGAMAVLRPPDYYGSEHPGMIRAVTAEHVLHAKLLRAGRAAEVLRMIEGTFASSVLHFDLFKLRDEGDVIQLWRIREYGAKHGIEYPYAAASLLAALPPKPRTYCDIEDAAKTPTSRPQP